MGFLPKEKLIKKIKDKPSIILIRLETRHLSFLFSTREKTFFVLLFCLKTLPRVGNAKKAKKKKETKNDQKRIRKVLFVLRCPSKIGGHQLKNFVDKNQKESFFVFAIVLFANKREKSLLFPNSR